MTIFDVDIARLTGSAAEMDRHRGSVVLVVNVASRCGFTSQYAAACRPSTTGTPTAVTVRFGSQTDPLDGDLVAVIEKLLPR